MDGNCTLFRFVYRIFRPLWVLFTYLLLSVRSDVRNKHLFGVERFDDVIATYMRERRIPGASVAVGRDGQFLIRKGTLRSISSNIYSVLQYTRLFVLSLSY